MVFELNDLKNKREKFLEERKKLKQSIYNILYDLIQKEYKLTSYRHKPSIEEAYISLQKRVVLSTGEIKLSNKYEIDDILCWNNHDTIIEIIKEMNNDKKIIDEIISINGLQNVISDISTNQEFKCLINEQNLLNYKNKPYREIYISFECIIFLQ